MRIGDDIGAGGAGSGLDQEPRVDHRAVDPGRFKAPLGAVPGRDQGASRAERFAALFGRLERRRPGLRGLDLGGLGLDQLDDVVDHVLVVQLMVGLAGHIDHARALRAAAGEADVGHQRLARAVDHAADDREAHGRGDVLQALLELVDRLDDVEALPRAGRAGDDVDAAVAQAQRLQDVEAGLDLLHRVGGERDADGVADAGPQQAAHADRRLDRARAQGPRLGDAQVQRAVDGLGQHLIGGDGQEDVGRLHADLEFVEVVILQDPGVVERALDHRLGTGLAVALQQFALQRAGVDADAHGAAVVARGWITSRTRAGEPMLPGLMRRHAAPALAASMPRL